MKSLRLITVMITLLEDLGLEISPSKLVKPTTSAMCLGVLSDTVRRTILLPLDKLKHTNEKCVA